MGIVILGGSSLHSLELVDLSPPRHPEVHVALHSRNPFAWVSGVRQALRRCGAPADEIARFSSDALAHQGSDATWHVVRSWVDAELL